MHSLQRFDARYAARPGELGRARRELTAYAAAAGVDDGQLDDVRLAVSEAVTNAMLHGYRGAPGEVAVCAEVGARGLSIAVCDGGAGLRPAWSPGLGCGLSLIDRVADEMSVRTLARGGTELRMRFALGGQPAAAAAA